MDLLDVFDEVGGVEGVGPAVACGEVSRSAEEDVEFALPDHFDHPGAAAELAVRIELEVDLPLRQLFGIPRHFPGADALRAPHRTFEAHARDEVLTRHRAGRCHADCDRCQGLADQLVHSSVLVG
nr:hypothetical protein [uncultured Propionivibrio sp.]